MSEGQKILTVDDEEALCNIVGLYLEDAGFKVSKATSANQALKLLAESEFDLVISDIRMPDGDGIELLNCIKKRNPRIPVVLFMTAFADISEAEAYNLGCEAIFNKPVDFDLLITKVKTCLRAAALEKVLPDVPHRTDIAVTLTAANSAKKFKTGALRVARGGFFVEIKGDLPRIDDILTFCLESAAHQDLRVVGKGTCRWTRMAAEGERLRGVGIEFDALPEQALKALKSMISEENPIAYIPIS